MHLDREIAPSPELISLVDSQGFASVKGQGPGELGENGQQQQLQQQYVSLLRPHPEQRQGRAGTTHKTFKGATDLLGKGGVPRNPKDVWAHE